MTAVFDRSDVGRTLCGDASEFVHLPHHRKAHSRVASGRNETREGVINENVWEAEAMQIRESRGGRALHRRTATAQTEPNIRAGGESGRGRSPPISAVPFSVSSNAQQSTLAAP